MISNQPPISNYPRLPKEHPSKFSLTKPTRGGIHSLGISLLHLIVLQIKFQSSRMMLKGMSAKSSLVAHSGEEK